MSGNFRLAKSRTASVTLDKFIKSQKNLSKPSPRLWPDDPPPDPNSLDDKGLPVLNLHHPILQKLESCKKIREFNCAHAQIVISGLSQHSLAASRVIKKLCVSFCLVYRSVSVFDSLHDPDAFLCNTILRSFLNLNDPFGALRFYYEKMIARCVEHNHYTFPLLGKVSAEIRSVVEGEKIHSLALKRGFESDLFVTNSLIHMYASCGRVWDAQKVFETGAVLDLVSWNSMIDGFVKNGEVESAQELFDEMPERDIFTWNSLLSGYVRIPDMKAARELFDLMQVRDIVSWNCMIDGYAMTENVSSALDCFNKMPKKNVVTWNIMLALYVRVKYYTGCLRLFEKMMEQQCEPNEASLMSILTAAANLGRLDTGECVHSYIRTNGIKPDILLSTAMLNMYAKCGEMTMAANVFENMPEKSIVSWNSMIMGYGIHGHGAKALEMFLDLEKGGFVPNDATFICLLTACAHSGMVLEGWWIFDVMNRVYEIEPKVEHYGCMVNLLGRAGLTKDSEELIMGMQTDASSTTLWGSLLSSCWTHSNSELGKIVAKKLIQLDPDDIGPYVLLSNIYAVEGNWDEVERVRRTMKDKGLNKTAAYSFVKAGESKTQTRGVLCRRMMYSMLSEIGSELKSSCISP